MKNEGRRVFHIRNESEAVIAKIIILKEFDRYMGVIFANAEPALIESEIFENDNELNHTIRSLIFKAGLSDFKDIKEVDS
jgi:hypothetical protein